MKILEKIKDFHRKTAFNTLIAISVTYYVLNQHYIQTFTGIIYKTQKYRFFLQQLI